MPSLNTVIKQASRGADLYFVFRFLRLLTMKYEKTDAYKYGIIDKKGKPLKRSSDLETVDEKAAYTMLHRLVFKVRRLIEKVPIVGKSILLNYAAALFLLKEQNDARIWTDDRYMGRKLMEFLENGDWEKEAELLREQLKNQYGSETNEFLIERKMTSSEIDKREKIVLSLKKKEDEFKKKYGDDWKNVMYATATKRAMGEEEEVDESFYGKITVPQINSYLRGLSKLMTHNEVIDHLKKHFNLKKVKFNRSFSKVLAVEEKEMKDFTEFQEDSASIDTKRERIRKQREKMGLLKKKSAPEKKEKDSPIRRAAKKAGMSRSDRKGLYNQNEVDEGTTEYAKSLEKIANDKKMKMISPSDRKTLMRLADLLDKEKKEEVETDENFMGTMAAIEIEKKKKRDKEKKKNKNEEIANSVGGGNVAGLGVGPQGEPGKPKKKKKKEIEESVIMATFAGKQVFVVDSDTYHQCRLGKKKYARYEKYVGKDNVGLAIREYGLKHPERPIILQNGENGPMLFLRYGRS